MKMCYYYNIRWCTDEKPFTRPEGGTTLEGQVSGFFDERSNYMSIMPIKFKNIEIGKKFLWNGKTYVKTEKLEDKENSCIINAVNIDTGQFMCMEDLLKCWIH